jgi:hypothetical protein
VHGTHGGVVLRAHLREGAAALFDVPLHAAHEADVRVGVDEELEIQLFAQALVGQHQDPLDDDHRRRLHPAGFRVARVLAKVVAGDVDGAAVAQLAQVADQELGLDGVGVVVVDALALGARQV